METLLEVRYRLCVGIFQSRTVKLSSVALQLTDLKKSLFVLHIVSVYFVGVCGRACVCVLCACACAC